MNDFTLLNQLTRLSEAYHKSFSIIKGSYGYYHIKIGNHQYQTAELNQEALTNSIFYIGSRLVHEAECDIITTEEFKEKLNHD